MHKNPLDDVTMSGEKYFGTYRGIVKITASPPSNGMVKVEILPMFKDISSSDLPWASPKWPLNKIIVPKVGTTVWVFFEGGDIYKPVYDGSGLPVKNLGGSDVGDPAAHVTQANSLEADFDNTGGSDPVGREIMMTPNGIIIDIDDNKGTVSIVVPGAGGLQVSSDGIQITPKCKVGKGLGKVITDISLPMCFFSGAPIPGTDLLKSD